MSVLFPNYIFFIEPSSRKCYTFQRETYLQEVLLKNERNNAAPRQTVQPGDFQKFTP